MSGNEHTAFAPHAFGRAARAAADRAAAGDAGAAAAVRVVPRRAGRLGLLSAQLGDRLPVTLQGRWRLDRRSGAALAVAVALAAAVFGGWTLFRAQSQQVGEPQLLAAGHPALPSPQAGPALPEPAGTPSAAAGLVVDVEGKVAKPGVIHLPTGSRVMDALQAAGGALPGTDLLSLNQARVVNDGEQILVGAPPGLGVLSAGPGTANGPPGASAHVGGHGKQPPAVPVHLNSATEDQLEELPGVGPSLAQRILDWRTQHGQFASVGQLQQVRGVGPATFAALRPWVAP
jgi:competence protein ComEA